MGTSSNTARRMSGAAMAIGLVFGIAGINSTPAQAVSCGVQVTLSSLVAGTSIDCGGKLYNDFGSTTPGAFLADTTLTASVVGHTDYLTLQTTAVRASNGGIENFNFDYDVTALGGATITGAGASLVNFSTVNPSSGVPGMKMPTRSSGASAKSKVPSYGILSRI